MYVVLFSLFVSLFSWSVSSPVGSSNDDNFHLASIWCANGTRADLCENGSNPSSRFVPYAVSTAGLCFLGDQLVTGACARDTTISPNSMVETTRLAGPSSSGLYYRFANLFTSENIELSVILIRLINSLVLVFLLFLAFRASVNQKFPSLAWVFILATIPYGLFFIASTNSSSWLIVGVGAYSYFLMLCATPRRSKVNYYAIAGAICSALVAWSSRGEASPFLVIATSAVVVHRFSGFRALFNRSFLVLSVGVALISSVLFFGSNIASFAVNSFTYGDDDSPIMRSAHGVFMANIQNLPNYFMGWMGGNPGIGQSDTELPSIVFVCILVSVGFLLFSSFNQSSWKMKMSVALVGVSLIFIPMWILQRSLLLVGEEVQPRYVLPLWVVFIGLLVFQNVGKQTRSQLISVAILLSIANAVALRQNLLRNTIGIDAYSVVNLDKANEWWWQVEFIPSPMTVWVLGSLGMLVASVLSAQMIGGTGGIRTPGPFEPSAFKADAFVHSATVPFGNASGQSAT